MIDFKHRMAAHCENGVISNLLHFHGINLSEAMVFGIGAGIYFTHLPMIKMNGMAVTSFRPLPGTIFKRVTRSLQIDIQVHKFSRPSKAMDALDKNLAKGIPTGMVVGVYHLSYFPAPYRFHFNAHNIVGIGKKEGHYLISDPVMEGIEQLSPEELVQVRYAKGTYKPRGKMYYVKSVPEKIDLPGAIKKGIKRTILEMVRLPGPVIGINGMHYLAKRIEKWPKKGNRYASRNLGQVIRMQEEIGTGGAGFRFLYAAFLQEASAIMQSDLLASASEQMTQAGDMWREFAVNAARVCKGRNTSETYSSVANQLREIAGKEEKIYNSLRKL